MKRGFSLSELMLVLAIMSIIMGTMKVCIQHRRIQADAKNIVECVKIYESVLTMYYLRNGGSFPENVDAKHLEEIDVLEAYRPTGFNTLGSIHSQKCQNIAISCSDTSEDYGIQITITEDKALADEIVKQLKASAVSSQITSSEASETSTYTVYFYIKKGKDIYI